MSWSKNVGFYRVNILFAVYWGSCKSCPWEFLQFQRKWVSLKVRLGQYSNSVWKKPQSFKQMSLNRGKKKLNAYFGCVDSQHSKLCMYFILWVPTLTKITSKISLWKTILCGELLRCMVYIKTMLFHTQKGLFFNSTGNVG